MNLTKLYTKINVESEAVPRGGGTPIQYLYGYVPPERGRDFEAPDLERGIQFRGVF